MTVTLRGNGKTSFNKFQLGNIPMKLLLGEVLALLSRQVEHAMPGESMEQMVARFPEDEALLGVVVGHDGWARWLLGESNQTVDVLHSLEGLLPQLYLDC
jgi:hypothetical protein